MEQPTVETMREQKAKIDDLIKKWPKTDQEILELCETVYKGLIVWSAWIALSISEKEREELENADQNPNG